MLAKAGDGESGNDDSGLCMSNTCIQRLSGVKIVDDGFQPCLAILSVQHTIRHNAVLKVILEKRESCCLVNKHQALVPPSVKGFVAR
jgi:hypothetical protein